MFDTANLRYISSGPAELVRRATRTSGAMAPGDSPLEFVSHEEVVDLLEDFGVAQVPDGGDRMYLRMNGVEGVVHLHLACPQTQCKPFEGAKLIPVDKVRLHKIVEHMIHLLHLNQVLLFPVGKWRKVFDAVAFSLAQNEDWRDIDAAATVELNTRDPLLCEPADFHTLIALIEALMKDADGPDQGLMALATASPVLLEVVPDGAVRISLGSQVLADELSEAFAK